MQASSFVTQALNEAPQQLFLAEVLLNLSSSFLFAAVLKH